MWSKYIIFLTFSHFPHAHDLKRYLSLVKYLAIFLKSCIALKC